MNTLSCVKCLRQLGYVVEKDVRPHCRQRQWLVFDPPDKPAINGGWPAFFNDSELRSWVIEDLLPYLANKKVA